MMMRATLIVLLGNYATVFAQRACTTHYDCVGSSDSLQYCSPLNVCEDVSLCNSNQPIRFYDQNTGCPGQTCTSHSQCGNGSSLYCSTQGHCDYIDECYLFSNGIDNSCPGRECGTDRICSYQVYEHKAISGNNDEVHYDVDDHFCKFQCDKNAWCRSFEMKGEMHPVRKTYEECRLSAAVGPIIDTTSSGTYVLYIKIAKKSFAEISSTPTSSPTIVSTQQAPRTAAEIVDTFSADEYVFDLLGAPASVGPGGSIQAMDANRMPSMAGHGMAATLFTLEPCGINQPHIHPRATETLYVLDGDHIRVAFVNENGHGVKQTDISKGLVTFFPQGLIHYQQNLSCKPATYLSMLNSEDPGVVSVVPQFLRFEDQALQAAFGSQNTVPKAEFAPGTTPGASVNECKRRCAAKGVWL